MSLKMILDLRKFNNDMQRFADIHGDSIETEDVQGLAKEFNGICGVSSLKAINSADSPDDAFEFLDLLAQETEAKARKEAPKLSPTTWELFDIVCFGLYSKQMDWTDDWEQIDNDLRETLPNYIDIRFLNTVMKVETQKTEFKRVLYVACFEFLKYLWDDIQSQPITLIEKIRIIKEWRDEYEPNISDSEGFGANSLVFEGLLNCDTWGELFKELAIWVNELVHVDWDENGEEVYGTTEAEYYLYLISRLIARIDIIKELF